jgi:hypothetical protein
MSTVRCVEYDRLQKLRDAEPDMEKRSVIQVAMDHERTKLSREGLVPDDYRIILNHLTKAYSEISEAQATILAYPTTFSNNRRAHLLKKELVKANEYIQSLLGTIGSTEGFAISPKGEFVSGAKW